MNKRRTPREAVQFNDICKLQSDNKNIAEGWIIIDGPKVVMATQRAGEELTGKVEFSRRAFNKLIDWYNKPQ